MYTIKELLQHNKHRPWKQPKQTYSYYQEWNKALFFHWKVDKEELKKQLPENLELDLYEGEAWISLVPFTMQKIRPRLLPSISYISDFDEINLRTYVVKNGKPGVYFLNIEAGKKLSADIARLLSGLPYRYSNIKRNQTDQYQAKFQQKNFQLKAKYNIGKPLQQKTPLDQFLTERYCLYVDNNNKLYRYEIQHLPWEIQELHTTELEIQYQIGTIKLSTPPNLMHYSKGVQVIAWEKELVI